MRHVSNASSLPSAAWLTMLVTFSIFSGTRKSHLSGRPGSMWILALADSDGELLAGLLYRDSDNVEHACEEVH